MRLYPMTYTDRGEIEPLQQHVHPSDTSFGIDKMRVSRKTVVQIKGRAEIIAAAKVRKRHRMDLRRRFLLKTTSDRGLHELHVPIFDDVECDRLHFLAVGTGGKLFVEGFAPRRQHVHAKVLERGEHQRDFAIRDETSQIHVTAREAFHFQRWKRHGLADLHELLGAFHDLQKRSNSVCYLVDRVATSYTHDTRHIATHFPSRIVELLELGKHVGSVFLHDFLLRFFDHDVKRVHHIL